MMTKTGTRVAIVATTACVLTVVAIFASVAARKVVGGRDYAVLSLPASYEDREAVALLSSAGIDGVVSESTQWIYVDSFEGLERVPLDRYRDRIETFDPRDDGYAERLRPLFVSDGRRRLFIPDASPSRLRVVTALFQENDLSLSVSERSAAVPVSDLILVALAALVALFSSGTPMALAAAVPALISLACLGPPGPAVASLLAASVRATVDPAREYFRIGPRAMRLRDHPWLFDGLPPALTFAGGALMVCILGRMPIVAAVCAAASFASAFAAIAVQELFRRERGHGRFVPVNMARRFTGTVVASRAALPFAAAALVSFSLSFFGIGNGGSAPPQAPSFFSVTLDEYRDHLDFQRSFSISRLGSTSSPPYGRYRVESDGLVAAGSEREVVPDVGKSELPPAERMLSRTAPIVASPRSRVSSVLGTVIGLVAAMAASAPAVAFALRAHVRGGTVESIADKRIAA